MQWLTGNGRSYARIPKAKQSREMRFLEAAPPSLLEQGLEFLTSEEVAEENDDTSNLTRERTPLVFHPSEE